MTDPTIVCPRCNSEIKLNESLAAPLIESTRKQYEQRITDKEIEVAQREAEVAKKQEAIADEVAKKLDKEKAKIAAEEAKKAQLLFGGDLETTKKEVADLQEVLKQREEKLAEAQKAQADVIRKQRELD